ncbi:sensor histidine kinase [Qingshengfaniella alkalisoli]|uniref:histidine kinase n=1 Tax=Qingshengfaniella alkalisoli TaxID=2599296 RepID=A0A5B8I9X6_9RHOB|nr:ATP-binding protein [Qingshengfaniella alkalisoli]QDY71155.1 PAS domain-containing protein [Qingshengfaniella alkalisoli]
MIRFRNLAFGLLLPLVAVVVFAVLLAFSLVRMIEIENAMRVEAEENMLWVLHQSEVAARRLAETAALIDLGEADTDDLALRFDILKGRVAMLNDGPQRRFVEEIGYDDELEQIAASLNAVAPIIAGFSPGDGVRLRAALEPVPRLFGRAANKAMIADWNDLGGRLETHRAQLRQITVFLVGIMVAGGILAAILGGALRQSRQRNMMLRRSQDFSTLLISSSGEGILAVDRVGLCTLWNKAMVGLIGKSAEQVVGRPLIEIAGFFDLAPLRTGVARALDGDTWQLALQPLFGEKDAEPRYVDLRFFPMRNEGEVIGAILFLHDATDRHAAQQREAEDRDRLEDLVAERTRDLDDALRRERSAADLYRNFAAMVSHQFRTPLAVADSALQRLIRRGARAEPGEIVERADRARNAIAGLTRLVDSTLDAARLDAGQLGAQRVRCALEEIVRTVCTRRREAAPERAIHVRRASQDSDVVFCDPAHVEQILENLLSNAHKYAPPETPVSIYLHDDVQNVFCDVHNTGNPIPEAERERIFDRNYRGTNSMGTAGTGIGLFMARTLARMQGGEVILQPGREGVTFRMILPRFDAVPA